MFDILSYIKRLFWKLAGYPMVLEMGNDAYKIFDKKRNKDNLEWIKRIKDATFKDLEYLIPDLKIINNRKMPENEFNYYINNKNVMHDYLYPDKFAVYEIHIWRNHLEKKLTEHNIRTFHARIGTYLCWLTANDAERIKDFAKTHEPVPLMLSYYRELTDENINLFLTKKRVKKYLKDLKDKYSAEVVEDLLKQLDIEAVRTVLCNLIKNDIRIKDLPYIIENLTDFARYDKNTNSLTKKMIEFLSE